MISNHDHRLQFFDILVEADVVPVVVVVRMVVGVVVFVIVVGVVVGSSLVT